MPCLYVNVLGSGRVRSAGPPSPCTMHSLHSALPTRAQGLPGGRREREDRSHFVLGEKVSVSPFPHEKMSVWHMTPDSPAGEAWWGRGQKRREAGLVCGMPVFWLLPQAVRPPVRPPARLTCRHAPSPPPSAPPAPSPPFRAKCTHGAATTGML